MTTPEYLPLPGGFTTNHVYKSGYNVVKSGPTVPSEARWYKAYRDKKDLPKIYSVDPGGINMEFIPSDGHFRLDEVIRTVEKYKDYPRLNDYRFTTYRKRIEWHLYNNPIHGGDKLLEALEMLELQPTFCHGDLSVNNIIPTKNGIKLIDPLYGDNFGSYWIDYAKLAFTLKFYRNDLDAYNALLARTGVPKVLIVSECVRVATYRRRFDFITENLINEM
jgi:hypothetical protein